MRCARRGFTLWELVLVLSLLGVLAGLALPAFTALGRADGDRPVDAVLRLLRDARALAVTRGATVSVVLDPSSGRYRIDTTNLAGATGTVVDTSLSLETRTALSAVSPRVEFVFFGTGAALTDSLLVRADGQRLLLAVDPWNGVVHADAR